MRHKPRTSKNSTYSCGESSTLCICLQNGLHQSHPGRVSAWVRQQLRLCPQCCLWPKHPRAARTVMDQLKHQLPESSRSNMNCHIQTFSEGTFGPTKTFQHTAGHLRFINLAPQRLRFLLFGLVKYTFLGLFDQEFVTIFTLVAGMCSFVRVANMKAKGLTATIINW